MAALEEVLSSLPPSATDAKKWINEVVRSLSSFQEEDLEANIAKLAMNMHIHGEKTDSVLQQSGRNLQASLPRQVEDSNKLAQSCFNLQSHLSIVAERLEVIEHDTLPCMRVLSRLNTVRSKVKECHDILDRAQQWARIQAQVEEGFAHASVSQISQGLSTLRDSLSVLKDIQDYEARSAFVAHAQKRLEALLMPRLLHALRNADVEDCQSLLSVYRHTGQLDDAKTCYIDCRQGPLFERWNAFQKGGVAEGQGTQPLIEWLPSFLDNLLSVMQQEAAWVRLVFGQDSSRDLPGQLVTGFLNDIHPSFRSRLQVAVGTTSYAVNNVLPLFKLVTDFASRVMAAHICSEEWETKVVVGVMRPFEVFHVGYVTLERSIVLDQLNMLSIEKCSNNPETAVQVLVDSSRRLFMLAEDVVRRFFRFTGGANTHALVDVIGILFEEYCNQFLAALKALVAQGTAPPSAPTPSTPASAAPKPKNRFDNDDSDSDDSDDDFGLAVMAADEPDLKVVKVGLELQPVVSKVAAKLAALDLDVGRKLAQADAELNGSSRQPLSLFMRAQCPHLLVALHDLCHTHAVDANHVVFANASLAVSNLLSAVRDHTTQALLAHVVTLLQALPRLNELTQPSRGAAGSVLTFSKSPLPYITRIGQYLLMLPEQIDPYTDHKSANGEPVVSTREWLELVAKRLVLEFTHVLQQFPPQSLTLAKPQLQADAGYLKNIFVALGVNPESEWNDLMTLLEK